jgi:cytochrome P450
MAAGNRLARDRWDKREGESRGVRSEIVTGPVADWATDFSRTENQWAADPYQIQDDLRRRCPIAHTNRFGGAWLPTRFEDVSTIAYDTVSFSSRSIIMGNFRPPPEIAPVGGSPPITSDPPYHRDARKLLLSAFTKTAAGKLEPMTRAFCYSLIGALDARDLVDAAAEYAQHIPVRVISECSASRLRTARSSASSPRTSSKASTFRKSDASRRCRPCTTTCWRRFTTTSTIRVTT